MKSNKSVKAMICDVLDKKLGYKSPFGNYFDEEGYLMVCCLSDDEDSDDCYEDLEFVTIGVVSLDASGNIQAVSKG